MIEFDSVKQMYNILRIAHGSRLPPVSIASQEIVAGAESTNAFPFDSGLGFEGLFNKITFKIRSRYTISRMCGGLYENINYIMYDLKG